MVIYINKTTEKESTGISLNASVDTVTVRPDFAAISQAAHVRAAGDVVEDLESSEGYGLSDSEATRRLNQYGRNVLKGGYRISALSVLVRQLGTVCILLHQIVIKA